MTLKLRGFSQVSSTTVVLSKITDVSAGKILGRSKDSTDSGSMSQISGSDVRKIAELHSDNNVEFANIQGSDITAVSATLSGDLDSSGDISGSTFSISGAASLGSASISGTATVGSTLGITGALTGSSASFSGALDANSLESTLDATIGGDANISGDMSSATADVSGLASLGSASISGAATVGSTLGVTGALSGSSASFSGALSALSLSSTNDATIGGDANISGDMSSSTATISGLANLGSLDVSGNAQVDGNLVIDGNLLIKGDTVEVQVQTLQVEDPMIKLGHGSADDSLDLGFYGLYNDGNNDLHAGLFRDASDGKFKLFKDLTSEPSTSVADVSNNKATLVADIEGDISYVTDVSFQISGDISGSATFSGNNSPDIAVTIQDDSVQLSNIDFFKDEDDMASDSELHVASQSSIKKYLDDQVASFGQLDLEQKDMLMVDSTGEYVKVKEIVECCLISSNNESNDSVTIATEIEVEFKDLSSVYLNGQKLRYSDDDGTSNDYWFPATLSESATKHSTDLTADDAAWNDWYGSASLSQDGNVLAVGAARWDQVGPAGTGDQGGVYIYDWDSVNEEWDKRGDVFSPSADTMSTVRFGQSTSLSSDGTYLAVGVYSFSQQYPVPSGQYSGQGAAYVYKWNSSTNSWDSHGSRIVASDAGASDRFSNVSISSDGTVLAVGSHAWDATSNVSTNEGAVYIYDWNSTTEDWDQRSYESGSYNILTASDDASGDQFGRGVSLSSDGEILFVGAPEWEGDYSNQGGVYIYDWDSSQDKWVQRGNVLESNSSSANANFGYALDTNGDGTVLLVTEYLDGASGQNIQVFDWDSVNQEWDYRRTIPSTFEYASDFGFSVSVNSNGDKVCVGDTGYASPWTGGRVYTYDLISATTNDKINFNDGVISEDDKLEVRYIIKS